MINSSVISITIVVDILPKQAYILDQAAALVWVHSRGNITIIVKLKRILVFEIGKGK